VSALRDPELAELLANSPWERMQRLADAEMEVELDDAFERLLADGLHLRREVVAEGCWQPVGDDALPVLG
jgi:hypothetical protein